MKLDKQLIDFANMGSKISTGEKITQQDILKMKLTDVDELRKDLQDYISFNAGIDCLETDKDFINFYKQI